MDLQVGVKVLLKNEQGQMLIVKRSKEKYGITSWDAVGGRIEPGTTLLENLAREVFEETGLTLLPGARLIAAQDILPGDGRHIVRLTYIGKATGEIRLDTEENTEYTWMSIEEMRGNTDLDTYLMELVERELF